MAKILIVEDDSAVRDLMRVWLDGDAHDVTEAADGAAAIREVGAASFDLVVTDIVMPEMEGTEMIMNLRRTSPNLKIIAVSGGGAFGGNSYLDVAGKLGANRTLAKPLLRMDFLSVVNEVLAE